MHHPLNRLASELCTLLGLPLPDIRPDGDGVLAFTLTLRGVDVAFLADDRIAADVVQVLVHFGTLPAERETLALRELLHANLWMQQPGAPTFARHPHSGEILLSGLLPSALTASDALPRITGLVDSALAWRRTHFLIEPAAHAMASMHLFEGR